MLALSARYPDLIREILNKIETHYEEHRNLDTKIKSFFGQIKLPYESTFLEAEKTKLNHDVEQVIPSNISLEDMTHEVFNLIRSFSFVGDLGYD